ncbi:helix-turn-helix domain-containing protein [Tunicatimonas pelagia]|uniref:helix-turn-helix domain-containing protein n=1 Tax=Tunicatimonas pelagia TaxID=931531 RepID=UPI0026670222|nr:helix-turn-helix domain-containing protein [Tunicatimonas pelagia]WKN43750.1 helix-turn-helix domain-containing protein [Tunicatimonas pelagia]
MTSALFIWAFIQSFITGSVVSLVKRTITNKVLSGIFLALSINILLQYLFRYTNVKFDYAYLLFLADFLDFLLPTLILWYVHLLLKQKLTKRQYVYFLPAALSFLILLTYVLLHTDFTFQHYIGTPIHKVTLLALVIWKVFVVYRLNALLRAERAVSSNKLPLLQWPRVLMIFVGFTCFIALIQLVYHAAVVPYFEPSMVTQIRYLVQFNYILFTSSIILVIIYFPIKYPKILSGEPLIKSTPATDFPEREVYCKKLHKLIDEDQIHLDTELNEKALASQLGIPLYLLSRLLNEQIGQSFSQFINQKRVEAAKKMLESAQNKKLTNFAVAVDSGFRSESVFYVNFKKIAGMTPTQYKKSVERERKEELNATPSAL